MRRVVRRTVPLIALLSVLQAGCMAASGGSAGGGGMGGVWSEDVARSGRVVAAATWALDVAPFAVFESAEMGGVVDSWVESGRYPAAFFQITSVLAPSSVAGSLQVISLPRGAVAVVERTSEYQDPELGPTWVWTGTLYGAPSSIVTLTADSKGVSGTIEADEVLYSIVQVGDSLHVLIREPAQGNPPEGPPRSPPSAPSAAPPVSADPLAAVADPPSPACPPAQVDVLVVYTPRVESHYGTRETVLRNVRAAERRTNAALDSSGIVHRIRVVAIESTTQESTGYLGADLTHLAIENDHVWDGLLLRRAQLRADILSLWTPRATDYCGLGYKILDPFGQGQWGMHTVSVTCEIPRQYTFTHELGHNFGMEHNRLAAGGAFGIDPFSFGFRSADGTLLSVEALNCSEGQTCPAPVRRLLYSNPRVRIGTVPMGVEHHLDPVNSADNTRTALRTMCYAARWGDGLR